MKEKDYYQKIEEIALEIEANSRVRELVDNRERLMGYWNIGKLLVDAQGGETRAKYGNELIKKWSVKLQQECGKNYNVRYLRKMRQFYVVFKNWSSVMAKLSWTHFLEIIALKNENERNYYINQAIISNLSVRELREQIKNKSFERLSYADRENIKLIIDTKNDKALTIEDMIKDPILINIPKKRTKIDEKILHKDIIGMLENRFLELGTGFALIGHEYKIKVDNKFYKIDLLFLNYEINAFVVVEIKTREFKPEDKGQLEFYVNYVDKNIRKKYHNKTIGLLIVKKKNKYVIEYITNSNLYLTTYKLITKSK